MRMNQRCEESYGDSRRCLRAAVGSVLAGSSVPIPERGKGWQQNLPWRLMQARSDKVAGDMHFSRSGVDITSLVVRQAGNLGVTDFLEAGKV